MRFIRYLLLIVKNTALLVSVVISLIAAGFEYVGEFDVPNYILYLILLYGFVQANYSLYMKNAPEINISASLLHKNALKMKHREQEYISFTANYNLYINNCGNNVGIVENVKVDLIKFCKVKDKYLLNKIDVEFKEAFIADKEIYPMMDFMKEKDATKYPIIIDPKKTEKKILCISIDIAGTNREDFLETIEWIEDLEFCLQVDVKNNNLQKKLRYTIVLSKAMIAKFREDQEKSDNDLNEYLASKEE